MTQEGRRWWPEPYYLFGTAVIIDFITREILFTRSKDRDEWIPGAGGEVIIPADTSKPVFISDTALRETAEELTIGLDEQGNQIGLEVEILGPDAFYTELRCGELSLYPNANTLYAYYLASLKNPKDKKVIRSKKQPKEADCETIGIQWQTVEDFLHDVEINQKKTYPNIIRVLKMLQWVLNQQTNPFLQPMPKS